MHSTICGILYICVFSSFERQTTRKSCNAHAREIEPPGGEIRIQHAMENKGARINFTAAAAVRRPL